MYVKNMCTKNLCHAERQVNEIYFTVSLCNFLLIYRRFKKHSVLFFRVIHMTEDIIISRIDAHC
jgi:hypothetical protein